MAAAGVSMKPLLRGGRCKTRSTIDAGIHTCPQASSGPSPPPLAPRHRAALFEASPLLMEENKNDTSS